MSSTALSDRYAHIALTRFGLGAKKGGIRRISADPRAALQAEIDAPGVALIADPSLPTYEQACQIVHTGSQAEYAAQEQEFTARLAKHLKPEIGFVERLVLFFSNHFSMSVIKDGAVRATIGQLERDVIRANVLGSFEAMLLGVMQHPAMNCFLDNDDSIGPNSVYGRAWGVGLNHNVAREVLELHTLGVGGGYSEDDIDALAKILTGWSFVRGWEADLAKNGGNPATRGQFIFRDDWHEPGAQIVMGTSYGQLGIVQGKSVLSDLAHHPATAEHIAFKLIRHFITDEPTADLVNPVAHAFLISEGDLKTTAQALIDLPAAWSLPLTKARTPYELQIAEMRAMGTLYTPEARWPFTAPLQALGHLPWQRSTPDGYPDESAYWLGPDAMRIRLETAQLNARTLQEVKPLTYSPVQVAERLFGTYLSAPSRQAIADAWTQTDGIATLFMIPEFQRR